jgi:hypothetical protein
LYQTLLADTSLPAVLFEIDRGLAVVDSSFLPRLGLAYRMCVGCAAASKLAGNRQTLEYAPGDELIDEQLPNSHGVSANVQPLRDEIARLLTRTDSRLLSASVAMSR